MTQNMQNNPYGAYIKAKDTLDTNISNKVNKYSTQLLQGKGFLSFEKCKTNTRINGECPLSDRETVTPGSVIESQLEDALGAGVKRVVTADELNEIVGALLNQAFKAVVGGITGGLRGASHGSAENPRSLTDQLNTYETRSTTGASFAPYVPIDEKKIEEKVATEEAEFKAEERRPCVDKATGGKGLIINGICMVLGGGGSGGGSGGEIPVDETPPTQ